MNFATTKERIIQYIDFEGIKIKDFYKKTGIKRGFLDSDKLKSSVSDVFLATIFATFDNINPIWLITGEGEMLKNKQGGEVEKSKNLIPFYDDVATIGGTDLVADTYNAVSAATDYIDAGDWFPSATAAIRH
ncbi:hypothetical protein PG357_09905, partial [Riemerella anatipestifer]|nr:hypothetical protein [Riemerella anatipestifer]